MNTLLKSAGGITQVSADSRLLSNRLIFLEGKIDAGSAGEFVRQILILNPCPGQQCWWGDQLRSHDLRCDPGKPGTGRALLHRTCVQHGGRDRCVRIAWKIYPAAWGDDDP